MIKEISIYETKDGARFDTIDECQSYILDKIGEELDGIINAHMGKLSGDYFISRRAQMEVLKALMGDMNKCEKLASLLNTYI